MKKIKKKDTYGLLWNQDNYEKNISSEWIKEWFLFIELILMRSQNLTEDI